MKNIPKVLLKYLLNFIFFKKGLKNKIVKEKNNRNDNHRHKTINSVSAVCTIPPSPIIVDSVPPTPNTLNSETKNEYYAAPLELLPQNFGEYS